MDRPRRTTRGFTLIEVLIVIALIGVLAAVVIPSMEPQAQDQLRTAARVVATELAYARSLAVSTDSSYLVTFDFANNRLVIEHSGDNEDLDRLPDSPFRKPGDPETQHILDLDDLPGVGMPVRLEAAAQVLYFWGKVKSVEFGPLGETTTPSYTMLWLACGTGDDEQYIMMYVHPTTGLVERGQPTNDGPPAWLIASPSAT